MIRFLLTIMVTVVITACSSAEDELVSIQSDIIDHVKEPIIQIHEEMKHYEEIVLENPDESSEAYEQYKDAYTDYLKEEMVTIIRTSRDYLSTYNDIQTEEGQNVFNAYQNTYEAYFHLLEVNGQFLVDLLADEITDEDFDEFDQQLRKIDTRINEELDELQKLFSIYSEEYDITFVDPLY